MRALARRAVDADAEAIARLHIASWQNAYRGQLPDSFLDGLSLELASRTEFWRMHISTQSSARHEIWAADFDGDVRGFAALGPARRDDETESGEIYALYVDPLHWSQGVGGALLTHATARLFREFSSAILWVLASNVRARRFYERARWAHDGGIKIENLPDGTKLREVRYRVCCTREEGKS
jgi:GNAT superfamily N-acetyltransferase